MLQRDQRAVDLGLDVRDVAAVVVLVLVADDDVAAAVVRGETVVEEFDERRALIAALRGISGFRTAACCPDKLRGCADA